MRLSKLKEIHIFGEIPQVNTDEIKANIRKKSK